MVKIVVNHEEIISDHAKSFVDTVVSESVNCENII